MPNAVYDPDACLRTSLAAARRAGFDLGRLMFEFTENEQMREIGHVRRIVEYYRSRGFTTTIDDFGAGYAGLSLLAELRPDMLKLDMSLIRGIDGCLARQEIVAGITRIAGALGMECIAEGVETAAELDALRSIGIRFYQDSYIAKPAVETLQIPPFESSL